MIRKLALLAVPLTALVLLTACGTTVINNPPSSPTAPPSSWSAQQATQQGCRALATWENNPATSGPETNAHTSPTVRRIIATYSGTQFASDLLTWVDDSYPDTLTDAQAVDADCAAAGSPTSSEAASPERPVSLLAGGASAFPGRPGITPHRLASR